MPLVGKKHFPYTSKGMKDALKLAEKTKQKVKVDKKGLGGMVKKYANGGMAVPEEYSEGYPREGGERSAWFPEGQFLGMDIPEGSANIANILGGIALGGPGGVGRKSLQGMAKSVAAKRSAITSRSLADDILKSGKKSSEVGVHLWQKGMIPRGQAGRVAHESKALLKQQKKIDKLMKVKNSSNPPLLYKKVNNEIYKLQEMKSQVNRIGRVNNPDVYGSFRDVGEFSRVSRRAPSEVIPAAIRGEASRRMGSEGYQEGGMLKGKSHKQGGIAANVGNEPIEMEGGEFVVKKDSAQKLGPDILNYINKNGTLPKMSNGGSVEVNPYLKDYREAQITEASKLAQLPQEGSSEYEQLKKRRFSTMGSGALGFGPSGRDRWGNLQRHERMAGMERRAAERKARARSEEAVGSGAGNISMFGALKAAGDRKAAWKAIQDEQEGAGI